MVIAYRDVSLAEQWPDTWADGRNKHFLPRQIGSARYEEKIGQPRHQVPSRTHS